MSEKAPCLTIKNDEKAWVPVTLNPTGGQHVCNIWTWPVHSRKPLANLTQEMFTVLHRPSYASSSLGSLSCLHLHFLVLSVIK